MVGCVKAEVVAVLACGVGAVKTFNGELRAVEAVMGVVRAVEVVIDEIRAVGLVGM
jgi:hypothetical protein